MRIKGQETLNKKDPAESMDMDFSETVPSLSLQQPHTEFDAVSSCCLEKVVWSLNDVTP